MSEPRPPDSRPEGPKTGAISAPDFPALRSFLRGYFHQEMQEEYGSPEEAVREFCADASPEERTAVAKDWFRFLDQMSGKALAEVNKILTGPLGSACILTGEDLLRVSAVLSQARKPG